jgi:hypothetical protein
MRGAATGAIQALAGHADLTTTQRDMHLNPDAIDSAIGYLIAQGIWRPGEPRGSGLDSAR